MITAPFNFVPLSEEVFFPDWSEDVSHDVPFEDGESGIIDITITAKSPIFIRDSKDETKFCNHNGQYYIPGSSIKGMVRNVLEIMSFSKMDMLDDSTYAVRDLRNRELYMSKMTPDKTFCGFLKKVGKDYFIEDCGKPGRIKHREIDKIFNIDFASKFREGNFGNKAKDKIAKIKYNMIESNNFKHSFSYLKRDVNREIYTYDKNGTKNGTLVLTGQPSARKEPKGEIPSGKVYEFIFFENKNDIKISEQCYKNFLFAYFDERKTEPKESPDWTFWKEKLENGEKVPVFFQKEGKEVAHFGISYLYKLPYTHSVKNGIPSSHSDERKDLSETMFGYIGKNEALKGRIQFSHFKAISTIQPLEKRTEILGTPRASYYPIYIKQQDRKPFTTFMNEHFSISGWKRYPIHSDSKVKKTTKTGNDNVGTTFSPIKEGAKFEGKIRYHNLKKTELGALLSALTFHDTNNCFHNIGMAKSLGYGKIKLNIKNVNNIQDYLKSFETEISSNISDWSKSKQLKELLSMASEQNNGENSELSYMELKEFAQNKTNNNRDYLRNYTALNGIKTITLKSLISQKDLEKLKILQNQKAEEEKLRQEEQKRVKKEKEEQRKREEEKNRILQEAQKSNNIQIIKNFIEQYPEDEHCKELQEKITKMESKKQQDRYQKVNEVAQHAFNGLMSKKGKKGFEKDRDKFIKKWSQEKNNKGSKLVLDLVEQAKEIK